jgi:branched-chain amino acid transport system ATP-binding protein
MLDEHAAGTAGAGGASSGITLLRVGNLRGGYGGKPILQGVELDVYDGEITAIIGRNGVGKSTLMKSIIGLLPASSGSIRFADQEIVRLPAHARARLGLGYVPQGRDVFPRLSVEENLLVGFSQGRGGSAELDWMHEHLPMLRERRHQVAGTLSGGQQQQLAIGRVLVGKPRLLLLDEPSEGIQPSIVQDIGRLIVDVNRRTGLTVILVEQNIDMIRAMAKRCFVLDKGRIVVELTRAMLDDRDIVRRHLAL